MTDHPITPPPELVASLRVSAPHGIRDAGVTREIWLINKAYAAGADQELEACAEWAANTCPLGTAKNLRTARRPKPPSLKEQALESLHHVEAGCLPNIDLLRSALETIPDETP